MVHWISPFLQVMKHLQVRQKERYSVLRWSHCSYSHLKRKEIRSFQWSFIDYYFAFFRVFYPKPKGSLYFYMSMYKLMLSIVYRSRKGAILLWSFCVDLFSMLWLSPKFIPLHLSVHLIWYGLNLTKNFSFLHIFYLLGLLVCPRSRSFYHFFSASSFGPGVCTQYICRGHYFDSCSFSCIF